MSLLPPNLSQSTRFELHVSYSKIPLAIYFIQKSHGWRSLEGCSPQGSWGSDTTERLHFHFSLSCIGEGNGNHSSVLAWRIPGTEEPGGLPSMGSHRVRLDWSDLAVAAAVYMFQCYSFHSSHSLLSPLCPKSVLYICVSIATLQIGSSVCTIFLDSICMC